MISWRICSAGSASEHAPTDQDDARSCPTTSCCENDNRTARAYGLVHNSPARKGLNKAVIRWISVVQNPSPSRAIGQRYGEANAVSIDPGVAAAFIGSSSGPALAQAPALGLAPTALNRGGGGGVAGTGFGSAVGIASSQVPLVLEPAAQAGESVMPRGPAAIATSLASALRRAASTRETHQDSSCNRPYRTFGCAI